MDFTALSPPDSETMEVSLFGTGVGEALSIHLGDGEWALIDSCYGNSDVPLNLSYLQSIGVDVINKVKVVVATHWHDDHVKGISKIFDCCPNAQLILSNALEIDEFRKLVQLYSGDANYIVDRETSGVCEMGNVLRILRERHTQDPKGYIPPKRASADMMLYRSTKSCLQTISPSHYAVEIATTEISTLVADVTNGSSRGTVPRPERNHFALAIWLSWGDKKVLLGSDLEECGNSHLGWQAALKSTVFLTDWRQL